ncbi:hypothetical protein COCOR_03420 [Corallococcus coralloides DSM 2259]|uniref:Lipoprotein n=1 Tax=Corallococcus coralloides (strain ATCC 25202 / DSM 2259 / NBRC 100086 / M2) TaxID=1144275 RepID=H8MJA5_CORCM|nr:hypothetical protein [Corallococcus coralloides]AFE05220.1 hypothetical protein COCOR_03420 [Corallococcus coralloides DSM 2259]
MTHRSQPSRPPQSGRALFVALALLLPLATACGDEDPVKPGPVGPLADAGGQDASTSTPDASCAGATCDAGTIFVPPDAGPADGGATDGGNTDGGAPDAGPDVPLLLPVDLSAPSELLVRSDDFAVLRVGVERHEGFTGPVTLSVRGLPSEVFVADRSVSADTNAAALVVSVSGRVGPGTLLDATLVATAEGRSISRPLRVRVAGPSFALDPTFPVVPLGWTDTSRFVDVLPDGKVLTAHAIASGSFPGGDGFVLERHLSDGVPDLTFGMLGTVTHPRPAVARLLAIKALPTGGSLVAGTAADCHDSQNAPPCTLLVSRFLASGMLDTSFGDEGVASASFNASPRSRVKLLADAAGRVSLVLSYYDAAQGGADVYAVQRWEADGRPAAGFGTEGRMTFALPESEQRFDQLNEAIQRKDGSIVIAVTLFDRSDSGWHGLGFVGLNGATGVASWNMESSRSLHQNVVADGRGRFVSMLNTAAPKFDLIVQWYDENGYRISTAGTYPMPPRLLAVGSAGELFFDDASTPYTVGQIEGGRGLAVVRFTQQGVVDMGFGTNGLVPLDSRLTSVSGFIREPNGCLLAHTFPEPGLVRFWP